MAQACLNDLLRLDYHINRESVKNLLLARYAAVHLVVHVESEIVLSHIQHGADYFVDVDKPRFAVWLWLRERKAEMRPE